MTTATSLILIATGAVLAFAISYEVAGISIEAVGIILMVVGSIGLALAIATLAGYAPWGATRTAVVQPATTVVTAPAVVTPPTPPTNP